MNVSKAQTLFAAMTAAVLTMEQRQDQVKDTQELLEKQQQDLADAKTASKEATKLFKTEIEGLDDYGEDKDPTTPVITGTPNSDGSTIVDPVKTDPTGQAQVDPATGAAGPPSPTPIPLPPAATPIPLPADDTPPVVVADGKTDVPPSDTPVPPSDVMADGDPTPVKDGDTVEVVKADPTPTDGTPVTSADPVKLV